MASEPAEPTTRQDLTGQMSTMLRSAREEAWSDNRCAMAARALATRVESGDFNEDGSGLLADPAQTTELEKWKDAYQAKLGDFAAETLRTSRALRACTVTPTNEHVPRVVVGEALLGWRGAQEHIRAEITRDLDPEDVDARADLLTEVGLLRAERHVLTAERDELQARIEEHEDLLATIWLYVKWRYVTKQLTTEQKNLWADAVEKVSERHHPGEGAEADRWWQDDRPVRAALVGDQPTAEEPYRCPTLCDDDCESPCHEAHAIPRKRQHDVADCEARQPLSGEALRNAEERDDAAGDRP